MGCCQDLLRSYRAFSRALEAQISDFGGVDMSLYSTLGDNIYVYIYIYIYTY